MKKNKISGKIKALLFLVFLLLPWPKAYALTIDHTWVDQFSQLTDSQISQAISNRVIVRHASVGSNINNGLNNVYNLDHKYLRGNMVFQSRGNPGWQAKVDDLVTQTAAQLSKFDIFTMKYCYIDNVDPLAAVTINGAQTTMWDYYRSKMEELQAAYPTKKFIWWTMPIMTSGDANRDTFNNLVRNYANTYNIILFDVAAIESHDPQGNAITNNGREAMYAPYSSDGGHLTAAGEQRIAQAFWVLISEIAKVNTNVGDGNLALNKAPIAVSSTAAGSLASYALDGNIQTSWISAAGGTQTLGVDLGAVYPLASVVVRWGPAYATYYYVETSSNGTSWGPSYTVTSGIGLENLGITNNTRYIRIRATQGVDPTKYELVSLEVYPHVSIYNPDIQAPVISNLSSSNITSNSASISWSTNEPATSQVEYGATTSYGSSTALNSSLVTVHNVSLSGLTSGTTYHYRVRSVDSAGNAALGDDYSFTTALFAACRDDLCISEILPSQSGGRIDWKHAEDIIAVDKRDADGYYDVFLMNPDGSFIGCLTCDKAGLPGKHIGNPAWHPSGQFIVFQAEKNLHPGTSSSCTPGRGEYNDIWIANKNGTEFWRLTDLPISYPSGVLHPHFSHKGDKLFWAERYSDQGAVFGLWELKLADFVIIGGNPHISNIATFRPGINPRFFESHGFSLDDESLLFSGNPENLAETGFDIYWMEIATQRLINLTGTSEEWDEHAQLSPDGKRISWMSSQSIPQALKGAKTDFWMMEADGTNQKRITYFNTSGYPESTTQAMIAADNSWNKDGDKLITYFSNTEANYLLEFTLPIMGDVNDDKAVNALDIQACVNAFLSGSTPTGHNPDVDGNGNIDVLDVQAIVNIVLGV